MLHYVWKWFIIIPHNSRLLISSDGVAKHKRIFRGGSQNVWCLLVFAWVAGVCQPRVTGTVGAEPFSAKLRYTGTENTEYPNLIKVTVTMPHIDGNNNMSLAKSVNSKAVWSVIADLINAPSWLLLPSGMLPVVSTRPLSNFELTLSPDGTRVGNHRCSNLLDYTEVKTHHGFLTDATKNPEVIGETAPYQYSNSLRGSSTLRFYRNLNLEACLWEFTSYYDMSELLNDCGGTIGTDGQVSFSTFELWIISYPLVSRHDVQIVCAGRRGPSSFCSIVISPPDFESSSIIYGHVKFLLSCLVWDAQLFIIVCRPPLTSAAMTNLTLYFLQFVKVSK